MEVLVNSLTLAINSVVLKHIAASLFKAIGAHPYKLQLAAHAAIITCSLKKYRVCKGRAG